MAVVLELQGVTVVEDFLPLQLGNSDLILGIQWLEKLGTMSTNWKTQTIKFQLRGEQVVLKGDPSLGRTLISLKAMLKTLKGEGDGFVVELNVMEGLEVTAQEDFISHAPPFLQHLLQLHSQVFQAPEGLPPQRGHEHSIVLKDGTDPVSIQTYKYPHFQKTEIENLIHDMLKAGIIQPSHSPFSSPVLLAKKKDGS